jgi:hypothetical protein
MTKKTQKRTNPAKSAKPATKRAHAAQPVPPAKKSNPPKPPGKVYVLFGADEYAKPRAARFSAEDPNLLAKAVEAMHLRLFEVTDEDLAEIATRLPAGRLHANCRSCLVKGTCTRNCSATLAIRSTKPDQHPKTCRGPGTRLCQAMSSWRGRAANAVGGRPW